LIVAGMLMLSNNPGLNEVLHFNATMVVLGDSNMGKTDSLINGLGCCANINNMVSGSTTPAFVRDRRNMMSLASAFDDCLSLKTEENAVMETAQKAGHGTKTHGFKKALGGYAISTNLQMIRSVRIMGRTVYVFKNTSPFDKTRDAAADLDSIVSHQKQQRMHLNRCDCSYQRQRTKASGPKAKKTTLRVCMTSRCSTIHREPLRLLARRQF